MIYLTKAVFINSCQTFIFFPSSQASRIDPGWCSFCLLYWAGKWRRCAGRLVIYALSIRQVTPEPPMAPPDILQMKN